MSFASPPLPFIKHAPEVVLRVRRPFLREGPQLAPVHAAVVRIRRRRIDLGAPSPSMTQRNGGERERVGR